jgi:hypothetical protein
MRRCAFLVAVVVSLPSLRIVKRTFSPAISPGQSLIACSSGMPSEAAGPVVERMTPMWISARAIGATARSASARARRAKRRLGRFSVDVWVIGGPGGSEH